ncbi:hypothetical protein WOLCODRAFT_18370 [Wolfiporia cocos MD-104 SS10]|uniref:Uncharacterized protein n=1 Tax=Wolfiporia cocos (strain MD-104) TaxID=742152 RepID=A0A2H3JMT7_WOLCO|nr:hypothetical protein WOLCODRAFT_18370 [Wolfiporia cocos MD-104 SS10]
MTSKSKPNPLPLGDTLRDLALLRASDCDLESILPEITSSSAQQSSAEVESTMNQDKTVEELVARSYEFAWEARAALRLLHRDEVGKQGARLEDNRSQLEDVLDGLQ